MSEKRDSTELESFLRDYKNLSPYEFEDMVCEMFQLQGWRDVKVTSRSADKGRYVIGFEPDGD